jgi:hypothetical protein
MPVSPSSSVQRAREQLAGRLRDIRLDAGLDGRALSAAAGWHPAKTSRIESAKQAPSEADIAAWCRACGAGREVPDLIAASRAADSMYMEYRRVNRGGMRRMQEARQPLYERTRVFKAYCPSVVPGWMQTPEYATALLSSITEFRGTPDDVADAVTARMNRNRILASGNHRFALLLEETVLRYRIGGGGVMAGQLGHLLEAVAGLPAVALGVIPFTAPERPAWPLEQFTVFDDERVHVELLSAQVTVTAPSEITLYVRAFERLARTAAYGEQAAALVRDAMSALSLTRAQSCAIAFPQATPPLFADCNRLARDRGTACEQRLCRSWAERPRDRDPPGPMLKSGGPSTLPRRRPGRDRRVDVGGRRDLRRRRQRGPGVGVRRGVGDRDRRDSGHTAGAPGHLDQARRVLRPDRPGVGIPDRQRQDRLLGARVRDGGLSGAPSGAHGSPRWSGRSPSWWRRG